MLRMRVRMRGRERERGEESALTEERLQFCCWTRHVGRRINTMKFGGEEIAKGTLNECRRTPHEKQAWYERREKDKAASSTQPARGTLGHHSAKRTLSVSQPMSVHAVLVGPSVDGCRARIRSLDTTLRRAPGGGQVVKIDASNETAQALK